MFALLIINYQAATENFAKAKEERDKLVEELAVAKTNYQQLDKKLLQLTSQVTNLTKQLEVHSFLILH